MQIQATLCLLLLVGLSELLLPSQEQHPCLIANSMQQLFLDFIAQSIVAEGLEHVDRSPAGDARFLSGSILGRKHLVGSHCLQHQLTSTARQSSSDKHHHQPPSLPCTVELLY